MALVTTYAFVAKAETVKEPIQQPTPQEYLAELSGENFALLNRIIICESNWRADAKNAHSSASGIFQFISSTWANWGEGDVFNPYDNIRSGVKLFEAQGTRPWDSSKSCWQ